MNAEERSLIWPPIFWPPIFPPILLPPTLKPVGVAEEEGNRSTDEIGGVLADGPEILKRLYFRPDYRAVIKQYTGVMMKQLENDPEAQKAVQELLDQQSQGERVLPLLIAIAAGTALGYWAESKHH